MKQLFRKLTAIFLSASLLMIHAGAEGLQEETYPAEAVYNEQAPEGSNDMDTGSDETEADDISDSSASDNGETLTDIGESADTPAPENITDEELRRSIEEKTQEAIASSNGIISVGVELTEEEADYIERTADTADSDGRRSVYSPVNLGGSLSEYANDYFLDRMTSDERTLYTNLFNVCSEFAMSTAQPDTDYIGVYANFNPNTVSLDRMRTIYNLFYYSNPQFYFLRNGYSFYKTGKITPMLYSDFRYPATRERYSSSIASETQSILPAIKAERTELAKERAIYKYLCNNTTYQNSPYDQSIASIFVDRYSVCNGYALAAEYLCNAAGLDCIVAVGQNHAWNIINLGGVWYELDTTWMDEDNGEMLDLKWRNKSHDTFLANDSKGSHVYNSDTRLDYNYFKLPACTVDMHLEDENYIFDGAGNFYQYGGDMTDLVIPDDIGISTVYYPVLYNDASIKSVIIPEGIVGISASAFAWSSALQYVTIPYSMVSIGTQAFYKSSITDIYYAGTQAQWAAIDIGSNAIPANCIIHYNSQPPTSGIEINEDNFPDKLFRRFVSENFDLDENKFLSDDEISAVTDIDLNYWSVIYPAYGSGRLWSLKGVEYFTNLKSLNLNENNVSELDLSSNTALITLNCSANDLETLDLSKNTALMNVSCGSNRLTALDLTNNTSLVGLNCNDNSYDIGEVRESYSLSELPYLDPTRASEWTGAEYNADDNTLINITGTSISYKYNCGNGFKKIFTLTCTPVVPQPVSISVTAPTRTVYFRGEEVDPDGGIVTVSYDFGEPVNIPMTADMLSGYDISKTGKQNVTVTYEEFTDTFEVTYKAPSITGITVTAPTKITYFVGEEIDPDGGIVTVSYDFGAPVNVPMTADMLSGYDISKTGKQNVTVTYEEFTDTFEVTYKAPSITGITATAPTKTTYFVGEDIDPDGGIVTITFDYGESVEIAMTADMLSGYDMTTAGEKTVTATYEGFTDTFAITVKERATNPVVTATPGDGEVTLTWDAVTGAAKYAAYIVNDDKTTTLLTSKITDTAYLAKKLTNGTKYRFLVRAFVGGKWLKYTDDDIVECTPVSPKPEIIEITPGDGEVTFKWTAVADAARYAAYCVDPDGNTKTLNSKINDTAYTATKLTNGTAYKFYVRANVDGKWTKFTPEDMVECTPASPKPVIIETTAGDGEVTFKWTAVDGAARYAAYCVDPDGNTKTLNSKINDTTYTATKLTNGTTYKFYVRAYANSKWTKFTPEDMVECTPTSPKPVIIETTAGDGEVTFKWTAVDGAAKYAAYVVDPEGTTKCLASKLSTLTFTAKNLTNGTTYKFYVRAYVNSKWTKFTPEDMVECTPNAPKPVVTATPGDKKVTLTWNAVPDAERYAAYIVNDDESTTILASKIIDTTYIAKKLTNGTTYKFVVRAYVNGKWTKYTEKDIVSATPDAQ